MNGGGQHLGELQLAKSVRQFDPGADRAGDGYTIPTMGGHPVGEAIRSPGGRCATGCVETMQFLAIPQDAESVGPKAVAGRLHNCEGCSRGDGSVDGIAAALQDRQACLRGKRLGCRHDIVSQNR